MLTPGALARIKTVTAVVAGVSLLAVTCGVLVAGLAMGPVAATGIAVRNAATKFNTMATPELGQLPVRSQILDRKGHLIAYYYPRGIDRVPVTFQHISSPMRQAIVAIEDSRFWEHGAIDFKGTVRAVINNVQHKPIQGGSTLAQQYVKNVLILSSPNPQKAFASATSDTIGRKIRELRMAVRVEHTMSQFQLLSGYLNVAYFGNHAYGIQVAAHRYFKTTAAKLTLRQAALLAGLVENPARYDPVAHPDTALKRRNTVLRRMAQVGDITDAKAAALEKKPLGLHPTPPQSGCESTTAKRAAYFCDYVLAVIRHDAAYKKVWARLNGLGGLTITTTLDPKDQHAAKHAVNYEMPAPPSSLNPGKNALAEVLIQPGTGKVRAMAIDRPYGTGKHQNTVNYTVGPQYDGGIGVQIGSTGKVFTMVAALRQGVPFGYAKTVGFSANVTGYTNCKGQPVGSRLPNGQLGWQVHNDESEPGGHYTLYTGTTASINVYFAYLERTVGLCNVVQTAAQMGLTWPDGTSLLKPDPSGRYASADNYPTFTLGAENVAPIDVAAADATLPARGIYCHPIAITKIVSAAGGHFPVESAKCHRVLSAVVADAANYILKGDLTSLGTAPRDAIGRPAASKTGTADKYVSAFFVGYTPDLLGAVWVGNPKGLVPMIGSSGCYRAGCFPFMYGSMAPGQTWQLTFLNARLSPQMPDFVPVPRSSPLFSMGNGIVSPKLPKKKHHSTSGGTSGGTGGGGTGGGGTGGGGTGGGGTGGGTSGGG